MEEKNGKKIDISKILESLNLGGREEAIAKTIGQLTEDEKLLFVTYVYPPEDDNLAMVYSIAKRYRYHFLEDWLTYKLKLRTSRFGWRANQLVNIASEKRREEGRFSFLSRFFGGKREEKGLKVEGFE
ncbi:MAG: hypothetical protein ACPLYF_00500 [Fervidobacterium sp.]